MDIFHAILLGVVEGFTEFLPISSTAHLVLASTILKIPQTDFVKSFEIVIQLGAIFAVIWLYWRKFFLDLRTLQKIFVAFLPTAFIGFLLYRVFKNFFLEQTAIIVWTLLSGGIFLIIFEFWHKEQDDAVDEIGKISYWQSFCIGAIQSIAIVPGVSRAAATIIGGLFLGLTRKTIVEFSFLLAVPTMLAATGYDLIKTGASFSSDQFGILAVGFVTSFFVALLAIRFLLFFIQKNTFTWFGIYRIIIGLFFIFWIL